MALPPGTRLGPYEVLAPIDSGVTEPDERYKASDTRVNRVVSLKMLPTDLATAETKSRLERDSRTISSLNHPNIAALIEVGHHEPSTDFVVAEFVEGETLAERLKRGPLPLPEAIAVAIAVADSLDKAHRKGMVHGGLNPTTIVLSASGPKLLDFGVARIKDENSSAISSSSIAATRTAIPRLSATPTFAMPYLSPEQLAGSPADARSDIFSFGVVLYEMITGRPAFQEKTVALLMAAIQSVDPDATTKFQSAVPPALDHIIRRCLVKDPRQRLQTAWDLLTQLRWIAEGGSQIGVPVPLAPVRRGRSRALWAAVAVVTLAAAGMAPSAWSKFRSAPAATPVRFLALSMPTAVSTPPVLSPDGRWLIMSPGGTVGVISMPLNSVAAQVLIKNNIVTQPFFSPDGKTLGFFENGQLKKADISGGPVQNICEVTNPIGAATWSPDGVIIFSAGGILYRVSAAGGQASPITALDKSKEETDHVAPWFLPDAKHYLFLAAGAHSAVYLGTLGSTERTRLLEADSRASYAAPGYLFFNRGTTVFAQPFDAKALKLTGEPIRIADGVPIVAGGPNVNAKLGNSATFAVSQTGVFVFRSSPNAAAPTPGTGEEQRVLFLFDRNGVRGSPLGPPGGYAGVDLSPDGKRLVVHRHDSTGGDNWILDIAQNRMQRLTFDAAQDNSSPIWSPDGTKVAFVSRRNNKWGLYIKPADGTGAEELIIDSNATKQTMSWSPDGKVILYRQSGQAGDVWGVPVSGDKKPFALLTSAADEYQPQISPDGKWLAYTSNETNRPEIYIKPFPEGPGKWQVSTDGGQWPRWRADSKELYFNLPPNFMSAQIKVTGSSLEAGVPQVLFAHDNLNLAQPHDAYLRYAVSADGQKFLYSETSIGGNANTGGGLSDQIAAVADRGTGATGSAANVTVVLNWPQMLTKK